MSEKKNMIVDPEAGAGDIPPEVFEESQKEVKGDE